MKISVNMKTFDKPWGGGNNFFKSLKHYALKEKYKVINHLRDKDIDIILIICNLAESTSASFSVEQAFHHKKLHGTPIVQRINECDERKKTKNVNEQIVKISKSVDCCVFVSDWLKNEIFKPISNNRKFTIRNGANTEIFKRKKYSNILNKKIKIVTHHFSNNYLKGFEYYKKIDDILEYKNYSEKIEFTIIGNRPKDLVFKKTKLKNIMSTYEINDELINQDLYITASLNEPGPNHVVEALSCGLPIIYLNSGSMEEYVGNFGEKFNENNFLEKLDYCVLNIGKLNDKIKNYKYSAETMSKKYFDLFKQLKK